ncbi:MAG: NADH-quinone oxidoreductase subunit C [Verrucomicrobia bacterium]|nr:NADH-quinone oxidoreductase subunit C [Verrucomicrobiota bacterium]
MDVLALTQKFPQTQNLAGQDMTTFAVNSTELADIVKYLRDEQGFDLLADLCGMDWKDRTPQFGVVIHLLSTKNREYVRLHAPCVDDAVPTVSRFTQAQTGTSVKRMICLVLNLSDIQILAGF